MGFITVIAQHLNVADIYCKLMPHLNPFITQPIIQVSPAPAPPPAWLRPLTLRLRRSTRSWCCSAC